MSDHLDSDVVAEKGTVDKIVHFFQITGKFIYPSEYFRTTVTVLSSVGTGVFQAIITIQVTQLLGFKISALFDTDSTALSGLSVTIPMYGVFKLTSCINQSSIGAKISSRIRHGYLTELLSKPEHRFKQNGHYSSILHKSLNESLMIQQCLSNTVWNILETFACFICLISTLSFLSGIFFISIIITTIVIFVCFKFVMPKLTLRMVSPLIWLVLNGQLLTLPSTIEEREANEINQGLIIIISVILSQLSIFQISNGVFSFIATLNQLDQLITTLDEYKHDNHDSSLSISPEIKQARIQFINVNFTYPSTPQPALINFNLTIEPGQTIGLVNDSSADKLGQSEAILDLINGKYRPDSGTVLIDNQDPYENRYIPKQIASISAYNMDIVDGTIYDYVYTGLIGTKYESYNSIDQHRMIMKACKEAGVWSIAKNRSLQTQINGESILSVPERLKLTIARSLVAKPKILLLDQPIALVDRYTEPFISSTLHQISKLRTTILVHYHGSALHLTDRIIILSNGTIIEDSTHHELYNNSPVYQELVKQWKLSKRRTSITDSIRSSTILLETTDNKRRSCRQLLGDLKTASTTSILLFVLFSSLGLIILLRIYITLQTTMSIIEYPNYKLAYMVSQTIISIIEFGICIFANYLSTNQLPTSIIYISLFSTIIIGQLALTLFLNYRLGLISCLFISLLYLCGRLNIKIQTEDSKLVIKTYKSKREQLMGLITDKHTFQQFYDSAESDIQRFKRRNNRTKVYYALSQTSVTVLLTIASLYVLYYNVSIGEVMMIHLIITSFGPLNNGLLIAHSDYKLVDSEL